MNSTYRDRVTVSREVAEANFGRFVQRALQLAQRNGLTNADIRDRTGVGPSTFHRWRRGEWGREWPEIQKVIDFCAGLGIDPDEAFTALGISGKRSVTPEPPLDADLRVLARRLADPHVSRQEKIHIRATLQYLASLPPPETEKTIKRSRSA